MRAGRGRGCGAARAAAGEGCAPSITFAIAGAAALVGLAKTEHDL